MSSAITKHQDEFSKTTFGFWVYLMTDCVLFASLFAAYAVLRDGTVGGPGARELFDLNFVLVETVLLLISSLTCGLALIGWKLGRKNLVLFMLGLTFALGAAFLAMELYEFAKLVHEGQGWDKNAFLSAYFSLVGTHGLHIMIGLLWIISLVLSLSRRGFTNTFGKRLTLFALFWHFLDVIWIFIFTIVYLFGAVS